MRLDRYIVLRGLADSRTKAKALIDGGFVSVDGQEVRKDAYDIDENNAPAVIVAESPETKYVGRGGLKLEAALDAFSVDVSGKCCCDIGASTGGFTDCLLRRGAKIVYAVDSGVGQLVPSLRADSRVVSIEGFNARVLDRETLDGCAPELIVMDVSFISQTLLYDAIRRVASPHADIITLIKPQFEAGRAAVGKNGIVKDEKVRRKVIDDVSSFAASLGFTVCGVIPSPITGGSGNKEFLMHMKAQ